MDRNLWRYVNLLGSNEYRVGERVLCILLSICEHILSRPNEKTFRELRFDDTRFTTLFTTIGAMECLLEIGFIKNGDHLLLPYSSSLIKLQILQRLLSMSSKKLYTDVAAKKFIVLPESLSESEKKFFTHIVDHYRDVMRYENPNLQRKARRIIPIAQLEIATIERIRLLQKNLKLQISSSNKLMEKNCLDSEICIKDLFLLELLHWFKNTCFQWVDQPVCTNCKGNCTLESIVASKDSQISKIEIYKCNICGQIVEFPRYTDPEPLLVSRRGRCGEWAKTFTLLCRSLGYDARLICDHTDHLWTEVWSVVDMRWIHMDPCENIIDRPLMYEKGWHKKLTYIIAFSRDEVQDVTWRYTQDQENVMKRRGLCSEDNLLQFLQSLNEQRQSSSCYSAARKKYVVERCALELSRMLYMPTKRVLQNDEKYEERRSGSYAWKLIRGEVSIQNDTEKNKEWRIPRNEKDFEVRYFIVKDVYKMICSSNVEEKSGWQMGMDVVDGSVFRKVEDDWKMVYLARSQDCAQATVKWTFVTEDSKLRIQTFSLKATTAIFNEAKIYWELEGFYEKQNTDSVRISITDCSNFSTDLLKGCVKLTVTVTLTGGKSHLAWQHAQLFRHSLVNNSDEPSMVLTIQLDDPLQ